MTTQPPSPEAVEAARKYALNDKHLSRSDCALLHDLRLNNKEQIDETVARILAAEVERLRDMTKRQAIDICAYVAEVAELRGKADAVCEWIPGTDEWSTRCEASYSGEFWGHMYCVYCPNCGRKVKIQPQANENEQ